jgi:hypothetical protein
MAMGATGIRNGQPTWNTGFAPLAVILASFQLMAAQPLSDSILGSVADLVPCGLSIGRREEGMGNW